MDVAGIIRTIFESRELDADILDISVEQLRKVDPHGRGHHAGLVYGARATMTFAHVVAAIEVADVSQVSLVNEAEIFIVELTAISSMQTERWRKAATAILEERNYVLPVNAPLEHWPRDGVVSPERTLACLEASPIPRPFLAAAFWELNAVIAAGGLPDVPTTSVILRIYFQIVGHDLEAQMMHATELMWFSHLMAVLGSEAAVLLVRSLDMMAVRSPLAIMSLPSWIVLNYLQAVPNWEAKPELCTLHNLLFAHVSLDGVITRGQMAEFAAMIGVD